MPQIGLFPMSPEEVLAKSKTLAHKIDEHDGLVEEKDATSREYNERIKKLAGEIRQLAKEIRTEKEERQATEEEAPWQDLLDKAEDVAKGKRRRPSRGVDGETIEENDGG